MSEKRSLSRDYISDPVLRNALIRQPKNENYLQLNEFRFILQRIPNTVYFCQSANIPGLAVGETIQPSPYSVKIRRPGTSLTQEDLVLKFLVNESMANWLELRKWIKSLTGERRFDDHAWEKQKYSDASLIIMNSNSIPFVRVTFQNCWPKELGGIEFATTVTDINPATSSVTFAYTGYEVEYLT